MDWLTKKQVKEASEAGTAEALQCSIDHWKQLRDCTPDELRDTYNSDLVHTGRAFCALCQRFDTANNSCGGCPLYESSNQCTSTCNNRAYNEADEAVEAKRYGDGDDGEAIDEFIILMEGLKEDGTDEVPE